MGNNNDQPHSGTAKKVKKYLSKLVGQTLTKKDIRVALKLDKSNSSLHTKILTMEGAGEVSVDRAASPTTVTVLPAILGKKSTNSKPPVRGFKGHPNFEKLRDSQTTPAPQMLFQQERLNAATNAQPIDVSSLMQQVIEINEQNKVLRQALYTIAEILTQACIIESN